MAIVFKNLQDLFSRIEKNKKVYQVRSAIIKQRKRPNTEKQRVVSVANNILKYDQTYLKNILVAMPYPQYAMAKKGSSNLNNAVFHGKSKAFLVLDIEKFFPSTSELTIRRFFKNHSLFKNKLSDKEIDLLIDLTCREGHLLTGSPSSPALSFWANYKMFKELSELAKSENLLFTVYVDDLTFSGDKIPNGFKWKVHNILKRHNYNCNLNKTEQSTQIKGINITGVYIKQRRYLELNNFYSRGKLDNPNTKPYIERIRRLNVK